jgi:AraC family transcriptional regulator, regulatory protein of adaptative response / DNA-3-methyladenine glycosylase II
VELEPASCYALLLARDRRYDGVFFVGVSTTGIYCRPVCPARTPRPDRCTFYPTAASAEEAGYRACLRCRPERAPGHAPVDAVSRLVHRAVSRLEGGAASSVSDLAGALGVTDRHLRRAFRAAIGVSPHRYVHSRRLATARLLLRDTALPIPSVAAAAGFSSVRRLQSALQEGAGASPTALRRRASAPDAVEVTLDARPPLDAAHLLGFLSARAVPGIERVDASGYARTARFGGRAGVVRATPSGPFSVRVRCDPELGPALMQVVARIRALFDLDARPAAVAEHLGGDPRLGPSVQAHPGTRLPGAFDPFELAIRAVLGQQVSVRAATTLAGRLVAAFGAPLATGEPGLHAVFPTPWALAEASPESVAAIGLPAARARTLQAVARAVAEEQVDLEAGADPEQAVAALQALPGIGPWTASYVAMRALGWTDGFPAGDLVVKRVLGVRSEREARDAAAGWRPWRGYAVMHLWRMA